jgi:hypothetical protein
MSSQLNLEKVRRENGDESSSEQKILPATATKVAGVWRRKVLSGSAYTV